MFHNREKSKNKKIEKQFAVLLCVGVLLLSGCNSSEVEPIAEAEYKNKLNTEKTETESQSECNIEKTEMEFQNELNVEKTETKSQGEFNTEKSEIESQNKSNTERIETGFQNQLNTEKKENAMLEKEMQKKRIVCWGDSLTYGQGGDGVTYPKVLAEKLNLEVLNYGIQGETARQIAIRMGVLPMTTGAFEIPSGTTSVEVTLWQNGEDPTMLRLGDSALNLCTIGGVEGRLTYNVYDNKYFFTRSKGGASVSIAEGTVVETYASSDRRTSDIVVLFAGSNLPPTKDTVGELIELEKQMIDFTETEQYIVIGLTSKTVIPDVEEINQALSEAFGEHFLDIRKEMFAHGLEYAGIEPTKQDKKDIKEGEIPTSLRTDEIHGNSLFYRILGERTAEKIKELGYAE